MDGRSFVQAVYYRDQSGNEPVRDFIAALPPQVRASLNNQIQRLNLQKVSEPDLPFPHTSQVEGALRELRCHHGQGSLSGSLPARAICRCCFTSS